MWVGTSYGLNYRDGERFVHYRTASGDKPFNVVLALHPDDDDVLWVGTMARGLFRLKGDQIINFTSQDGLFDDLIHRILEDDNGNLWMTCNRGVFRVSKQLLNDFADGKTDRIECQVFGKADGLPSLECNGTIQPAGWKTKDGHLWFPTIAGVAVTDPASNADNYRPPPVTIEHILLDGEPVAVGSTIEISPEIERIEIKYTALSFIAPKQVTFDYRLAGLDHVWLSNRTERLVQYRKPAPGHYQFEVSARNKDGIRSATGASIALVVQPFLWQTMWFRIMAVMVILGGAVGAARWTAQRKHQRQLLMLEQEHALERERSRIARDMHDGLGSSVVKIAMLGELVEGQLGANQTIRGQVNKLTTAARRVVHEMDQIVWAINPKNDTVENFAGYVGQFATEHFADTGIDCHLETPVELPDRPLTAEKRHHLFLAVKEALNNVLKHANATKASLRIRVDERHLEVTVEDNGSGCLPQTSRRQGIGRQNMPERLAQIGGTLDFKSEIGKGTRIVMTVPLG
jgi:signal transduction histidine kinase